MDEKTLLKPIDNEGASVSNRVVDGDLDDHVYLRHKGREASFPISLLSKKKYAFGPGFIGVFLASKLPTFRAFYGAHTKVSDNLMFVMSGGIGDQVCAEPVVRYALDMFPDKKITILTHVPEIFQHLPVAVVRNDQKSISTLDMQKYWQVETCVNERSMLSDFLCMSMIHCIDLPALAAFQRQLPRKYKHVTLMATKDQQENAERVAHDKPQYIIHAGKTWESRTVPESYWREVIQKMNDIGLRPCLIGGSVVNKNTTVDIDLTGLDVIDVRDRLSLMETCYLLQQADVVLTNDSGPYHLAASGSARIGVFSTGRPFHYIHHFDSSGNLNPNIKNLALGNALDLIDLRPDTKVSISYDKLEQSKMLEFLPDVSEVIKFVLGK